MPTNSFAPSRNSNSQVVDSCHYKYNYHCFYSPPQHVFVQRHSALHLFCTHRFAAGWRDGRGSIIDALRHFLSSPAFFTTPPAGPSRRAQWHAAAAFRPHPDTESGLHNNGGVPPRTARGPTALRRRRGVYYPVLAARHNMMRRGCCGRRKNSSGDGRGGTRRGSTTRSASLPSGCPSCLDVPCK